MVPALFWQEKKERQELFPTVPPLIWQEKENAGVAADLAAGARTCIGISAVVVTDHDAVLEIVAGVGYAAGVVTNRVVGGQVLAVRQGNAARAGANLLHCRSASGRSHLDSEHEGQGDKDGQHDKTWTRPWRRRRTSHETGAPRKRRRLFARRIVTIGLDVAIPYTGLRSGSGARGGGYRRGVPRA